MRISIVADQHGELPKVPPCDLLIISGDITGGNRYGPRDFTDDKWRDWLEWAFANWLRGLNYSLAVAIGGNHDTVFEVAPLPNMGKITYLCDGGATFQGLRIWGIPWVPYWDGLAFNLRDDERARKVALIPEDTDILVCHAPPWGVGDMSGDGNRHAGCLMLRAAIERIQPRLVTCGHIHEGAGTYRLGQTKVVNAARSVVEERL